jgi:hypothetical protein
VNAIARSAWNYTERGQNRFGEHGAWFPVEEVVKLLMEQDAMILLAFLRANNGPSATFMCTNTLAATLKWRRERLAEARSRLIEMDYIVQIRRAGNRTPALFRWPPRRGRGSREQCC